MEGAELAIFMVSACVATAVVEYPASPVHQSITDPTVRRLVIGVAMGLTAIGIIYSPWGKQSGAHFNPAVTWTFWRLGLVDSVDAVFYSLFQFAGAILGVAAAALILGPIIADPSVHYIVTEPGPEGLVAAFLAETVISGFLMVMVLAMTNVPKLARFTGLVAGTLVATYIVLEAPISGMSMNPARTVGSAFWAGDWTAVWIYFTAPLLGMLLAAEASVRLKGHAQIKSAKLHHHNDARCIFRCRHHASAP